MPHELNEDLIQSTGRHAPWQGTPEEWTEQRRLERSKALKYAVPLKVIGASIALAMALAAVLVVSVDTRIIICQLLVAEVCLSLALVLKLWQDELHAEGLARLDRKPSSTGTHEWRVSMEIVQDGFVSGSDIGLLWVTPSRIYFTGEKTSFALGGADLASSVTFKRPGCRMSDRMFTIPLVPPAGHCRELCVRLNLVDVLIDSPAGRACGYELLGWNSRYGSANDQGQLPPLSLGPGSTPISHLWTRAVAWVTLPIAGGIAVLIIDSHLAGSDHKAGGVIFVLFVAILALSRSLSGLSRSLIAIAICLNLSRGRPNESHFVWRRPSG